MFLHRLCAYRAGLKVALGASALLAVLLGLLLAGGSQAATSNCPKISVLPCESVRLSPDRTFNFDGSDGGLADRNGQGLGFTMVDPPAHNGNPTPNPLAPGYWPDRLELAGGRLVIAPTAGVSFSDLNSQDNALGIGLDLNQPAALQTTLLSLGAPTGGFAQAGLWFGRAGVGPSSEAGTGSSEDNYIKMIVIAQLNTSGAPVWEVQMLWEANGAVYKSTNGPVDASQPVTLYLELDPALRTVTGRYCALPGCDPKQAPIFQKFTNVPASWFSTTPAGIDPTVGTRSMGGVFASLRQSPAALSFTFEDFKFQRSAAAIPAASSDGVDFNIWNAAGINAPTALAWGPDNRLYAAGADGLLSAYTFDYTQQTIASKQIISVLQGRMALGLAIDPASTPGSVILWVAHSSQNPGQANSGVVSRLAGPSFAVREDVITGLPRALSNHATGGLHFGADGRLYIAQGGNTGAGAANDSPQDVGKRPEQPLSAAILVADVKAPGFDGTCASEIDPTGASMDATGVSATDHPCDVQVYASGLRAAYDFVFHSNGQMYAPDNGLRSLSTFPALQPGPLAWNPAAGCEGLISGVPAIEAVKPHHTPDLLQRIVQGGYYGHPNPARGECVFFGGNPTGGADFLTPATSAQTHPDRMDTQKYPVGMQPAANWKAPLFSFGLYKSANGILEYNSHNAAFCGKLDGDLLVTYWSQDDQVRRLQLSPDGAQVISDTTLIRSNPESGGSFLVDPLPIVQDPGGRIYVGEYSSGQITVLDPVYAGEWQTQLHTQAPAALLDAGSAVLNGRLYIVAGRTAISHERSLYTFDPATNHWERLADLPAAYPAVESPAVVAYNGKLYVFGGSTEALAGAVNKAAVYDPGSNAWAMLPDMPVGRGAATAQVIGSLAYLAGGMDASGNSLASIYAFDLGASLWLPRPALSVARDHAGSAVLGGKLYVFGGQTRSGGSLVAPALSSVEIFTSGIGWVAGSPMPTARRSMSVVALNGEAVVIGGEGEADVSLANQAYNPANGNWRLLMDLPAARHGAAAGVIGNIAFLAGGGNSFGASFTADLDAFYFDCAPSFTPPAPDLIVTKSHAGNIGKGQSGAQFTLVVSNQGSAAASGAVTVSDDLPAGMTLTGLSGAGWTCSLASAACTRSDALAAGASYPPVTVTVDVSTLADDFVTNQAGVSGGGELYAGNNLAVDPLVLIDAPDLMIVKTHSGQPLPGQLGFQYAITVTNQGALDSSGAVTVTDELPAGLTATALGGTGWSCILAGLTCTRADALTVGASYPVITLTAMVAAAPPDLLVNVARVAGGGELYVLNNIASDPAIVFKPADLTLTKTHTGDFRQGQSGARYRLAVSNQGAGPTAGAVSVVDSLPAGLSAAALGGPGWICTLTNLTCTRSDALAAGASYPIISLEVKVAGGAPASLTNSASVAGGGEINTGNNAASDLTAVVPAADLTISKTHTGDFEQGQAGAVYTLTVQNIGPGAAIGQVTVREWLPEGLSIVDLSGFGWTCDPIDLVCRRSDALAAGASYPVIHVIVDVDGSAPAYLANTATVVGGGELDTSNNLAVDPTTVIQLPVVYRLLLPLARK